MDLIRNRDTMDTAKFVVWLIVLVVLPVVGLVVYLLWRLARSDAMLDAMEYQGEHPVDPFDRPGLSKD
jgi:heme/copper-type cytochrome/quinol oxidase subunit 2